MAFCNAYFRLFNMNCRFCAYNTPIDIFLLPPTFVDLFFGNGRCQPCGFFHRSGSKPKIACQQGGALPEIDFIEFKLLSVKGIDYYYYQKRKHSHTRESTNQRNFALAISLRANTIIPMGLPNRLILSWKFNTVINMGESPTFESIILYFVFRRASLHGPSGFLFCALTRWGRVTHICVVKLTLIGSDNGLSPGRRQAIIWTNAEILLIGPIKLQWNFDWNSNIFILENAFQNVVCEMASILSRPQCVKHLFDRTADQTLNHCALSYVRCRFNSELVKWKWL